MFLVIHSSILFLVLTKTYIFTALMNNLHQMYLLEIYRSFK